jgi:hypothetical protein
MGVFDSFTGAGASGDWAAQAAAAQAAADEAMKSAGMPGSAADLTMADAAGLMADRDAITAQANEQNRILTVGSPVTLTIVSKVDTGEKAGGNPIYALELSVVPETGDAYTVSKREIIGSTALSGYADGTTMAGRVDPADKNLAAFGDKPFR